MYSRTDRNFYRNATHIVILLFWCLVSSPVVSDEPPAQTSVDIHLRASGELLEGDSEIALEISQAGTERKDLLSRSAAITGSIKLQLESGQVWSAEVVSDEFWSPGADFYTPPGSASVSLDVFPTAVLKGRLWLEDRNFSPDHLSLRLSSPEPAVGIPEVTDECPLSDELEFTCKVPAERINLRLRVKGHVSQYLWELKAEPGETKDIGVLELKEGASLTGTIETEDNEPLSKDTKLELQLFGTGELALPEKQSRAALFSDEFKIAEDGFFHLKGVDPGTYVLTVRKDGYAPAVMAPVSILPGSESEIREPIVLREPLRLEVVVVPPADAQGRSWSVEVLKEGLYPGRLETVAGRRQLPPTGAEVVEEAVPGRYFLSVTDSEGSQFAFKVFDVDETSDTLLVDLDLVGVEGEVSLGEEPLGAATLWFGGRTGRERIKMTSNEVGWFEGVLPRSGDWQVDISSKEPAVNRVVSDLNVPEPTDSRPVRIDIELPETVVTGKVITEEGGAISEKALVTAVKFGEKFESPIQEWTREDGKFELHGLRRGNYQLTAEAMIDGVPWTSEPTSLRLAEGQKEGRIEVVIRPARLIEGKVISPAGPVPLARVRVQGFAGGRSLNQTLIAALTDTDGHFQVAVPSRAERLKITVMASGHMLKAFSERVPEESSEIVLNVQALGGTLNFRLETEDEVATGDLLPVVYQDGKPIGLSTLASWASANGRPLRDPKEASVPLMAPGEYLVCYLSPEEQAALTNNIYLPREEFCSKGYLQPRGQLEVGVRLQKETNTE